MKTWTRLLLVLLLLACSGEASAQGSLTIPNTFAGKALGPLGALDQNWQAVATYVNGMILVGPLANRPPAGVATRLYLATDLNGGTTYIDTGTQWSQAGAAAGPALNVKDFGAKGDNTTNDTAAINLALTAAQANGGTLYFPRGFYLINQGRLNFSSTQALQLFGDGIGISTLRWIPATDSPAQNKGMLNISGTGDADALHCTGVTIHNLSFDFGGHRTDAYNGDQRGVNIYNCDNVHIFRNLFQGARGEMVGLGNWGSPTTPGSHAWVIGNLFYDFRQDGVNPNVFNANVIGNTFHKGDTAIEGGRNRLVFEGNAILDMNSPAKVSSVVGFAFVGNRLTDCLNTNTGSTLGCIEVVGQGANNQATDGAITANTVTVSSTFATQACIYLTRGTATADNLRISVTGNTCNGTRQGIVLDSLKDGLISNNVLVGDSSGGGAGILLNTAGQVQKTTLLGNTIRGYAARTISPTTNGPIQDQTVVGTDLNVVGWNIQENQTIQGVTGRIDFADLATTPSVALGSGIYFVANSAPTTITNFTGGATGQVITLVFNDANTRLDGGANLTIEGGRFQSISGASITLLNTSLIWVEIARSQAPRTAGTFTFANIATYLPNNGMIGYCSDCTLANPCAGGGTGAVAMRLNAVNVCTGGFPGTLTTGVQVGAPTGGDKGAGTINLAATTPLYVNGNPVFSTGTPTCGTGCATIVANSMDSWGAATAAAATSVAVAWSHTLNRAPFCTVSDNSTTQFSDVSAVSTTGLTVTFAAAFTGTIYWNCGGAG